MASALVPPINAVLLCDGLKLGDLPVERITSHGGEQLRCRVHAKNDTAGNIAAQACGCAFPMGETFELTRVESAGRSGETGVEMKFENHRYFVAVAPFDFLPHFDPSFTNQSSSESRRLERTRLTYQDSKINISGRHLRGSGAKLPPP